MISTILETLGIIFPASLLAMVLYARKIVVLFFVRIWYKIIGKEPW